MLIATTAHWAGDVRLNRHVSYLQEAGWEAELVGYRSGHRIARLFGVARVMADIIRRRPEAVILPDPELFIFPALAGRLVGTWVVVDVHEDYGKAALARSWIPSPLKRVVSLIAGVNTKVGRVLANATVVAAPELARDGDVVVLNLARPVENENREPMADHVVYVGDLTEQRGALDMVDALPAMPNHVRMVLVGPCSPILREAIERRADLLGVGSRLEMTGQLDHAEAWATASGAIAGLSLLHPTPAYSVAVGTKVWEYMAYAIPPIVSNLPGQASVVSQVDDSLVVDSPAAVGEVVRRLATDAGFRETTISRGLHMARTQWEDSRPDRRLQEAVTP